MATLIDYVNEYGDIDFKKKKFNDIDNLIFSTLSYLDFLNTDIDKGVFRLEYIGKQFLKNNKYKEVSKQGIPQKEAYKLLKLLVIKERYKNILILDYISNSSTEIQFSAITFQITKKLKYICFEGTDELVSGWKEDCELACFFPIPSHVEAIKYVNNGVKLFGPKIIIGGHSKGGNLALVSGMFMKWYKKIKIKKIYSNDGPGLRKKEFNSLKYKLIKRKYIHIVPDCSLIGVLLRNDKYKVIKSTKNNIYGHSMSTWVIDDDKLVPSKLSLKSKRLEKSLISWLDLHNDEERIKIIKTLFKVLEDSDIYIVPNMKKIKNIIKIIQNLKVIDKETKKLTIDLLVYNFKNVRGWNYD